MYSRGNTTTLAALRAQNSVAVCAFGAGMASVRSLGLLAGFAECGLTKPSEYYAYSGGAINGAQYLTSPEKLPHLMDMYERCATGAYLEWKLGAYGPYLGIDNRKIVSMLSVHDSTLESHATNFSIVATDDENGKSVYLNGRSQLQSKLTATTALRGYCKPIELDGCMLSDGITSFNMRECMQTMKSQHLIVLTNLLEGEPSLQGLEDVSEDLGKEVLVIGPEQDDELLTPTTSSISALRRGYEEARRFVVQLCGDV